MEILFTSDLHLGHENILLSRGKFRDIEEHNMYLIDKWNAKVQRNDHVHILGDLSYRSPQHISYYLSQMKGKKHLIVGNHDNYWMKHVEDIGKYFETVDYLKTIKFDKKQVTLCHYPMLEWPGSRYGEAGKSYLIHGHIHGRVDSEVYGHIVKYQPHALNAGVDINNFEPVTFEELKINCESWYARDEKSSLGYSQNMADYFMDGMK